jgi:enediyne biosynthesis protein E4
MVVRKKLLMLMAFIMIAFDPLYSQIFEKENNTPLALDNQKSFGSAWVDYDNDGLEDLFVVNMGDNNTLFKNMGDGTFKKMTQNEIGVLAEDKGNSFTTSWADFNNDGYPDVFIGNFNEPSYLYMQNKDHQFVRVFESLFEQNSSFVQASSWVDFDLDGDLDLFVGTKEKADQLFENLGDAGFQLAENSKISSSLSNTHGIAWSDINNDNYPDLFLAQNTESNNSIYYSTSNGEFRTQELNDVPSVSIGATWVDIDNDLDMDLFVTNAMGKANFLYSNTGKGELTKVQQNTLLLEEFNSMSACWGDYDNDGDQDVFIANSGNQQNSFYLNDGNGEFQKVDEKPLTESANSSRGCSCGDYDNDGDLDLFISNGFGEKDNNELYINKGNVNGWFKIKLVGKKTSTPIGARIIIKTTDNGLKKEQMRELSSQSGAYGHNSHIIHFGMGQAKVIDELIVRWSNGETQTFKKVSANKAYTLLEGGVLK